MSLRLYVPDLQPTAATWTLPPGPTRHVQVRRLQPGDTVVLFDGSGAEWDARIEAIGRSQVTVAPGPRREVDRELDLSVTLALGVPANERMDWLVEKATELGVARICPLMCERSVLRLDGERGLRKRDHWQAVAVAAAEQCGRTRVPVIEPMQPLAKWLEADGGVGTRWLLSLAPGAVLPQRPATGPVVLLSGPEGGLSPAEDASARAAGYQPVTLGPRVLRAETAPLAVLARLGLP